MDKKPKEQLALFGKNRYHDWVIFFFTAVFVMVGGAAYNVWLYMSTDTIVQNASKQETVASKFDAFREDVSYLLEYLENDDSFSTSTVPRDPSLR